MENIIVKISNHAPEIPPVIKVNDQIFHVNK